MLANILETIWILFTAVVVFKLLHGDAGVKGLLKGAIGTTVQPERVQLVVLSLVGIAVYVFLAVANLANDNPVFPDAPDFLLWTLIVSLLLYVVGKFVRNQ
jgi:hypothetical protein